MAVFALTGLMVGAIIASRFTVLSLLPLMLFCFLMATAGALFGSPVAISNLIVLVGSFQIGYLIAAALLVATNSALRFRSFFGTKTPQRHLH